ncbi:MAG: rRNA maturation RNase YbeY [Candidatus Spechtbacteria bacterium]|nr:rRNA maturation RNase YbeY [Candidatus Spechtbacteria bacterium]
MSCRVVNETVFVILAELLEKCVEETVRVYGKGEEIFCSLVLVEPEKIQTFNEKYYDKKGVTDVLTFESDEENYAGDIIICPAFIKEKITADGGPRDAAEGEDSFEWEMCHVTVHGTLHLLGIHHEEAGEDYQKLHEQEKDIINKVLNK